MLPVKAVVPPEEGTYGRGECQLRKTSALPSSGSTGANPLVGFPRPVEYSEEAASGAEKERLWSDATDRTKS